MGRVAAEDLAGYKLHYGKVSRSYQTHIDTGTQTTATVSLGPGTYYFAVSAYNSGGEESALSEEVSTRIRVPDGSIELDGDGIADITVRRPEEGRWFTRSSSSPSGYTIATWGRPSDIAVPGDYDGDKKSDISVWRPESSVWYVRVSSAPGTYKAVAWGLQDDEPIPGDYDGDGKTDIAVWRPSTGVWYVRPSGAPDAFTGTAWGQASDVPVPGDYDGDGKTDKAVWRPDSGSWYILSQPYTRHIHQCGLGTVGRHPGSR